MLPFRCGPILVHSHYFYKMLEKVLVNMLARLKSHQIKFLKVGLTHPNDANGSRFVNALVGPELSSVFCKVCSVKKQQL